jgi:hypothetical protein
MPPWPACLRVEVRVHTWRKVAKCSSSSCPSQAQAGHELAGIAGEAASPQARRVESLLPWQIQRPHRPALTCPSVLSDSELFPGGTPHAAATCTWGEQHACKLVQLVGQDTVELDPCGSTTQLSRSMSAQRKLQAQRRACCYVAFT